MRIVGGKYKGRQFASKDYNARPTTDFARESLFNILNNYFYFEKLKVLDLFAGTGSISFEFASRGCENIELIENDPKNYRLIYDDIKTFDFKQVHPVKTDAIKYLSHSKPGYDIIFADPPYDMKGIEKIADLVFKNALLKPEGWFILEHSKHYHFQEHEHFKEERNYGAVHFSIFI